MSAIQQNRVRPVWLSAILGGFTHILLNLAIEIHFPDHWAGSPTRLLGLSYADWSRLLWIPPVFLLVALIGVYARVSTYVGRLGKFGFILTTLGFGFAILGNRVEFWIYGLLLVPWMGEFQTGSEDSQLGYAIIGFGAMFLITELLLLGIACLRSTMPIRYCRPILMAERDLPRKQVGKP